MNEVEKHQTEELNHTFLKKKVIITENHLEDPVSIFSSVHICAL